MTTATDQDTNTEALPDLSEALASISADLFPENAPAGDADDASGALVEEAPAEAGVVADQAVAPPPTDGENSAAVVETGAPKTWTKDALETWAAIPPRAQAEILKREEDMFKGLEQYKEKAALGSSYDSVVEPYRAVLAAENINPVEMFSAFAKNHYILARGTPDQKIAFAAEMLKGYNIPVEALFDHVSAQPYVDPTIANLQQQIQQLSGAEAARQQQAVAARQAKITQEVEAFYSDPANIYAADLADDIAHLIKTGAETTLKGAYETAMFRNPTTRGKEMARLQTEAANLAKAEIAKRAEAATAATSINLKSSGKTLNGTVLGVGTMDETLNETLAAIQSRGA